ncbi:hypothetical protein [Streptomyces sp. KLOTTS4A1]|uniref:hypothetical protein n=1 Tax=Streptomyces sp. KLOTTS4A1 TaxID=3390996 RepID=UPI0039F453A2
MRQPALFDRPPRTAAPGRPLRLTAVLLAAAASAGCMSIGADEGEPAPKPTTSQQAEGSAPGGRAVVTGGARGGQRAEHREDASPEASESATPSASPSEKETEPSRSPVGDDPGPAPSKTRTKPPEPSPTEEPAEPEPSPSPTPSEEPSPQPSDSSGAHETQMAQEQRIEHFWEREPSPQRGPA